jgi:hypothetical protein
MDKETTLRVLEWCIRLTYIGMPLEYVRLLLLKKHERLEKADDSLAEEYAQGNNPRF